MSAAAALGSVGERPAVRHLLATLGNPVAPKSPRVVAELCEWSAVLRRLQIPPELAEDLARRAEKCCSSLPEELLMSGRVTEVELYRQAAVKLGVGFRADLQASELRTSAKEAMLLLKSKQAQLTQIIGGDGIVRYVATPGAGGFLTLRDALRRHRSLGERLSIVPPSVLRRALIEIARPELRDAARDGLFVAEPQLSARLVTNGWQGLLLGGAGVAVSFGLLLWATATWLALHICATLFFFSCVVLRLAAFVGRPASRSRPDGVFPRAELPVYSVLIALYDEVEVIPELIVALGKLSWPRSRLEVKFICECDDRPTIEALRAQALRPWVEIVEVPRGMLRTKPNALTYALALSKGDFIAIYDAEDRPHPLQLLEAWRRFASDEADLACLQAPIDIENGDSGILSRMFELEYAALFHRLLPYLAQKRMPLPLGGTSNHFRRSALDEVGGWDPYNVTEDADLGVRLARHGYRTGVLHSPTGEDAPDTPMVWMRQRTRWLKGWAQTWLVHMRDPGLLMAQVGFRSFVGVQVLLAGLLASALLHPLLLLTGGWLLATAISAQELSPVQRILFMFDVFNIVFGYGAFLLLGWRATPSHRRRGFWKLVLFTPVYWLMTSIAAWRAGLQLLTRPHYWEKTPHKRRRPPLTARQLSNAAAITPSGIPVRRR
jgi:cellulose synthase/poly-beta-1,6-N-acetylglucosamine synthase-like glycosyltransferase